MSSPEALLLKQRPRNTFASSAILLVVLPFHANDEPVGSGAEPPKQLKRTTGDHRKNLIRGWASPPVACAKRSARSDSRSGAASPADLGFLWRVFASIEFLTAELRPIWRVQHRIDHLNELGRHKRLLNESPAIIENQ